MAADAVATSQRLVTRADLLITSGQTLIHHLPYSTHSAKDPEETPCKEASQN